MEAHVSAYLHHLMLLFPHNQNRKSINIHIIPELNLLFTHIRLTH